MRIRETDEPLEAEDAFFAALVGGNIDSLRHILADDFVIIDLMRGAEIGLSAFLDDHHPASRYTHVFAREAAGAWRLVSAHGTPIIE